jgi:hypothetical protein
MDAGGLGFLVAGSRREFVVLNVDDFSKVSRRTSSQLTFSPFWLPSTLNGL